VTLQTIGNTTNFTIQYDDSLVSAQPAANQAATRANIVANCNYLLGQVEGAFTTTTGWFATPSGKFGTGNRQVVELNLVDGKGASNNGYGSAIQVDSQSQNSSSTAGPVVSMLWMAEWAEILMSVGGVWNALDSSGEGLSHYCAQTIFPAGHNDYYGGRFVSDWLNGGGTTNQGPTSTNPARGDWVTTTYTGSTMAGVFVHGDGDPVSYGCALVFLYYLTTELGFTINEIIANYNSNLASAYKAVTGDQADPFPGFLGLLNSVFPPSQTFVPATTNPDNPFPIVETLLTGQKDTFGSDEVKDIMNTQGGLVAEAFWVFVSGLSQVAFQNLGITVGPFTGAFTGLTGVKITPNAAGPQFQNGATPKQPQLIRIPFDVTFDPTQQAAVLAQFPPKGSTAQYDLSTTLVSGGQTVTGSPATMQFELLGGADPYFTNIPQGGTNQPYLSQDLRVFTAAPAINQIPFPGGPTFSKANDNPEGAYAYITALLKYLNGQVDFTNPAAGTDPFAQLPGQDDEGQTDSSVAPLALVSGFPLVFANNYNFAIARVRLQGSSGATGAASDVRVFFRVFSSQSADTDYDPNGTYASNKDTAGKPGSPKPGAGYTTIPFFATANAATQTDYQTGGPNIHTLTIPVGQDKLWTYYGCFLNFYDPNNKVDNNQVQTYFPGTHHCVVAEIAFDDSPIPAGVSPMAFDQLAQRNLSLVAIDNPGPQAAHLAPQTFDVRPSGAIGIPGAGGPPPDQLMIDWGDIPKGSTVSIYWPAVHAAEVIALARTWGGAAGLAASDAHTLTQKVEGGVSYIPIPKGSGANFAGLFTVEVPLGVTAGQSFEVLVRRIGTRRGAVPPPPPPIPQIKARTRRSNAAPYLPEENGPGPASPGDQPAAGDDQTFLWRYVIGAFLVRIPVSTGEKLRMPEEFTLAIMKWRLEHISHANRWRPVLERYIRYCSERLEGFGGDPGEIPPSLTWRPPLEGKGGGRRRDPDRDRDEREICGKVAHVLYDCHGAFEGFVLDECCEKRFIESRDRGLGEIVLVACRENLTVCVRLCEESGRVEGLAIRG
jgi:hypothetical protein